MRMTESLASPFSKKTGLYFAILLLGCLCTASVPLWVRLAHVGPATAGVWRMAFALPFFLLWMYVEPKELSSTPPSALRTYGLLAFAGGTFALDILLFNSALVYAPVTNVSILGGLAPFVIIFKAMLFERLRVTKFMTGALVIAFIGVVLLTLGAASTPATPTAVAERGVFLEIIGSVLALASSLSYGLYLLCLRQARNAHVSTGRVVGISVIFSALGCLIISFLGGENLIPQTTASWLNLVGLGVIGHVLGHGLMTVSLRHVPAILASSSIFLLPAFSTFLAWVFLGESITWLQLFGGGLVLSALLYLSPRQENTA
jgi:drug/metabolite transporter (DMT)-like permease